MFNLGTAVGKLILQAQGVATGVRTALGSLKTLERESRKHMDGVYNATRSLQVASAAIAAAFVLAAKSSIEWESALAGVQRTTDTTEAGLNVLEKQIRAIAAVKPIDPIDLAGIAEEAGALGVATQDIAQFTGVVADLVASTELTTDEASSGLARLTGIMGDSVDEFDNVGSAVLELGRSTKATDVEILNMARRIAGVGSTVGLSTDQVLGYAAALASVGVREEQGGSAISRMFVDLQTAVSEGGKELELFAKVAGSSVGDFKTLFERDASEATTRFIEGLGKINAAGGNVLGILKALGLTEVRQRDAILRVAQATQNYGDANVQLRNILQTGATAINNQNILTDVAARRYETTAAKIQIAKNRFKELLDVVGTGLLPLLNITITLLNNFITAWLSLPPGVQTAMSVLLAVMGVMAALGAIIIRVLPILYQFSQFMKGIKGTAWAGALTRMGKAAKIFGIAMAVATIGMAIFGAHVNKNTKDIDDNIEANKELQSALAKGGQAADDATNKWIRHALANDEARAAAKRLGVTFQQIKGIIAGTDAEGAQNFVRSVQEAEKKGDKAAGRLGDTVARLRREYVASANAARIAAESQDDYAEATEDATDAVDEYTKAEQKAYDAANARNQAILDLVDAQFAQREATLSLRQAEEALDEIREQVEERIVNIARAEEDLVRAREDREAAARAVVDAERALATARQEDVDAVLDAEQQVADLRDRQVDQAEEIADLEEALAEARANQIRDYLDAVDDAADANDNYKDTLDEIHDIQERLTRLRTGATLDEITKATNRLRNAQLGLRQSHQELADAEWYLQYLRERGASSRDIQDAEWAVDRSRQNTADATQDVSESEEELEELRRAADPREIAAAERDLARARRDAAAALRDINARESDLAERRQDIANDTAYRDAERDLGRARRDQEQSVRDMQQAEQDLAEARQALAEDRSYTEAVEDLRNARWQERDAVRAVEDAERSLRDLREDNPLDDLAEANLALEQAYYRVAAANVEVLKQTALMNGEHWDAGRQAQAMADQLVALSERIKGPIAQNLRDAAGILNRGVPLGPEPENPDPSEWSIDDFEIPEFVDPFENIVGGVEDVDSAMQELQDTTTETKDVWDTVWSVLGGIAGLALGRAIVSAISSFLIGRFAGGAIGGAIGTALGGPIGTAIGILLGLVIGWLIEKFLPGIVEWVGENWRKVPEALAGLFRDPMPILEAIGGFFTRIFGAIGGWLQQFPEKFQRVGRMVIESILGPINKENLTELFEWGKSLPEKIFNGARDNVGVIIDWFKDLPGNAAKAVGEVAKLHEVGYKIINAIVKGLVEYGPKIAMVVLGIPLLIIAALIAAVGAVVIAAGAIILGILTGIGEGLASLESWLWENFVRIGGGIIGALKDGLEEKVVEIWMWLDDFKDGVIDFFVDIKDWIFGDGKDLIVGFFNGIGEQWSNNKRWFSDLPENIRRLLPAALSWIKNKAVEVITGFFNGIREAYENNKQRIIELKDKIRALLPDPLRWLFDIGSSILTGLFNGFNSIWPTIHGFFTRIGGRIRDVVGDLSGLLTGAGSAAMKGFGAGAEEMINWVKRKFSAPMRWIADNVINKFMGLLEGFAGKLGIELSLPRIGAREIPEYHEGGEVGKGGQKRRRKRLRNDEEVAILLKGERVLSREEAENYDPNELRYAGGPNWFQRGRDWVSRGVEAVGGLMGAAIDQAREFAASIVRPGIEAGLKAMELAAQPWGAAGKIATEPVRITTRSILDWISGADEGANQSRPQPRYDSTGSVPVVDVPLDPQSASLVNVGRRIQQMGYSVGEHPMFGGVHPVHTWPNSYHYKGRAVDINWYPREQEPQKLDWLFNWIKKNVFPIAELLWRVDDHYDHLHLAMADGGITKGPTRALIGESGPEAVLPLARFIRELVAAFEVSLRPVVYNLEALNNSQARYLMADAARSNIYAAPTPAAASLAGVGARSGSTVINEGDTYHIEAHTDANPDEIMRAAAWKSRTRKR